MKDRRTDGQTDGRTNGPTGGTTDRRMDRQSRVHATKKIRVKKKNQKKIAIEDRTKTE